MSLAPNSNDEWRCALIDLFEKDFLKHFGISYTRAIHDRLLLSQPQIINEFVDYLAQLPALTNGATNYTIYPGEVWRQTGSAYHNFAYMIRSKVSSKSLSCGDVLHERFHAYLLELLRAAGLAAIEERLNKLMEIYTAANVDMIVHEAFQAFTPDELINTLCMLSSRSNIWNAINTYAASYWFSSASMNLPFYMDYIQRYKTSQLQRKKYIAFAFAQLLSQLNLITGIFPPEGEFTAASQAGILQERPIQYGELDLRGLDLGSLPRPFHLNSREGEI